MKKRIGHVPLLLLIALLGSGCASAGGGQLASGDPNFISQEEIRQAEARNAYELIERLRPRWFQSRGGRSFRAPTDIVVYQNRTMLGGLEALRDLNVVAIAEIRYLDSAEAGRLPGMGSRHVEGAIVVHTTTTRP